MLVKGATGVQWFLPDTLLNMFNLFLLLSLLTNFLFLRFLPILLASSSKSANRRPLSSTSCPWVKWAATETKFTYMMTSRYGKAFRITGPLFRGIQFTDDRSKGWWCRALVFSLLLSWVSCQTNSWVADDLRCHGAHETSLWWEPINTLRISINGKDFIGHDIFKCIFLIFFCFLIFYSISLKSIP